MQAVPKFKNSAPGHDRARLRVFSFCHVREIGLAKIYSCTKFDVSSFTHSKYMEEGLKFKIWALDLTMPFRGYFVTDKMGFA